MHTNTETGKTTGNSVLVKKGSQMYQMIRPLDNCTLHRHSTANVSKSTLITGQAMINLTDKNQCITMAIRNDLVTMNKTCLKSQFLHVI